MEPKESQDNASDNQPVVPAQDNSNPFDMDSEQTSADADTTIGDVETPVITPETPVTTSAPFAAAPVVSAAAIGGSVVASTAAAPMAAAKKPRKWLIPVIAAGAVVLMAGGASAYYFGVYQNPENVLYDMYSHLAGAKAMQMNGNISFDMPNVSGFKLKSIEYKGNFDNNPSGEVDLTAKLSIQGTDISVGGKGMYTNNGDLYFQINGLVDAVKAYALGVGQTSSIPQSFYTALGKLQDQWVMISLKDIEDASASAAKNYKCVVDTYKKHKDDSAKPLLDAFKKNAFVVKKDDLGVKDGLIGYKLNFDSAKLKAFGESVKDTDLAKDLATCGSTSTSGTSSSSTTDEANMQDATVSFWIDQWSHELKKVEYSGSTNGTGSDTVSKVSFNGSMGIAYDTKIQTKAPTDVIDLEEFKTRANGVSESAYGSGSSIDSLENSL